MAATQPPVNPPPEWTILPDPNSVPQYSPNDLGKLSVNVNGKPRRFSVVRTASTGGGILFLTALVYFGGMAYRTVVSPLSITIPDPEAAITGQLIPLQATTNADSVKWKAHDAALSIVQDSDFTKATVTSDAPGTYTVHAIAARHGHTPYSAQMSDFIQVKITIKAKPTPTPVPPAPTPQPPAPTPSPVVDPFQSTLANAFKTDGSPTVDAMALASLLTMGAKGTANDPTITTLSALFAKMHDAEDKLEGLPNMSPSKLMATRTAIAKELTSQLGDTTKATPLTADLRTKCAAQFTRMAMLLNGLGS